MVNWHTDMLVRAWRQQRLRRHDGIPLNPTRRTPRQDDPIAACRTHSSSSTASPGWCTAWIDALRLAFRGRPTDQVVQTPQGTPSLHGLLSRGSHAPLKRRVVFRRGRHLTPDAQALNRLPLIVSAGQVSLNETAPSLEAMLDAAARPSATPLLGRRHDFAHAHGSQAAAGPDVLAYLKARGIDRTATLWHSSRPPRTPSSEPWRTPSSMATMWAGRRTRLRTSPGPSSCTCGWSPTDASRSRGSFGTPVPRTHQNQALHAPQPRKDLVTTHLHAGQGHEPAGTAQGRERRQWGRHYAWIGELVASSEPEWTSMMIIDGADAAKWAFILVNIGTEEDVEQYVEWYKAKARSRPDSLQQVRDYRLLVRLCMEDCAGHATDHGGRHLLPGGRPQPGHTSQASRQRQTTARPQRPGRGARTPAP